MEPYKEEILQHNLPFPVDIFISDNSINNISADPHWHDCCEILYILEGTAEQQINEKYFKTSRHDLVLLNEGDIHSTYCAKDENTRILVIKFLPEIVEGGYSRTFESKYILPFLNNRSDNIYHLPNTSKNSSQIYNLMMGLYSEFSEKAAAYEIYIKGYIYQLIACLVRNNVIQTHVLYSNESDMKKLDALFKYIEKNYNRRIDLKEAADMLNLSYFYFSRYFKKTTGKTFKQYVDFVRICEVEKLILLKDMNISQAAYEAGFCNVSSFNRVFKRVKGYLPGEIKRAKTAKK